MAALIYSIGYKGLRQPEIFRFAPAESPETAPVEVALAAPSESPDQLKRSHVGTQEAMLLESALVAVMEKEHPWKNSELTLSDLATRLDTTPHKLSDVLNAQMGKAGPPMDGKDLHVGDWSHGVLPAMAPLGSPALTIAGIAMAFAIRKEPRVAISFIGEGATSLGEWHEAINACAARKLPAIFCVQSNQTALSTPLHEQSAARVFADQLQNRADVFLHSLVGGHLNQKQTLPFRSGGIKSAGAFNKRPDRA